MDQPGKVANPARGRLLSRENEYFPLFPLALENVVSRNGFGSPVPRRPAHLHTQAEYGAYMTVFLPISATASIYLLKPPYAMGSVPSLSGHAIAYQWRSLPRVRRHRARKPQGSSKRMLPWQVSMDQFILASIFPHPLLVGSGHVESNTLLN